MRSIFSILLFFTSLVLFAQQEKIPKSYSNLSYDKEGVLTLKINGEELKEIIDDSPAILDNLIGKPKGTEKGIAFDFGESVKEGVLYYGFIPYHDMRYPMPVYFKRVLKIEDGKVEVNLSKMTGRYDMISWEEKGIGTFGYRVQEKNGYIRYEGIVAFKGKGPFKVADAIVEGPLVAMTYPTEVILRIKTNRSAEIELLINDKKISSKGVLHEIKIDSLKPNTNYAYTVKVDGQEQSYSLKTAPNNGSRTKFRFAYASDSRSGIGGGERDFGGVNAYIVKKIAAYARLRDVSFMQFTGDLIDGYNSSIGKHKAQYANWKSAISPWAHYFPVIPAVGNHEVLSHEFRPDPNAWPLGIDRFPFETESLEAIFAQEFTLPTNGPESEDGAYYDPSKRTIDFPSYKENAFYYTYDNVAVVVLNSHYWYATRLPKHPETSGAPHGYMMENQIKWMKETVAMFEKDGDIDHIFITQHTPTFPNGGHTGDGMWYSGKNDVRAIVAGKAVKKGVIDVRDEYLDFLINKSTKVRAILTGDEHNYARTEIGPETNIYPKGWTGKKIKLSRTIHQINNGAAGAPYYAQEELPWTDKVSNFSTQNAVVIFEIEGETIKMEVINPDSFDEIDKFEFTF
ncbi:MAG: metallophosphoesterase [Flavobacteriales bacterium]|nr:metallophosphoesterase [Flavobacteriales bacterium]